MRIAIGSDHRGHLVRVKIIESLERHGHEIYDTGTGNNGPEIGRASCRERV